MQTYEKSFLMKILENMWTVRKFEETAADSFLKGEVKGNVRASDSVTCGDISGSVSAERVRCTKAGGEEQESFTFTKKGKSFSFPLR